MTKTETQVRSKFAAYFLDLQADLARDGVTVNKQSEWEFFIEHCIEEGEVPAEARSWKCPRSLKSLVFNAEV
jgi:hypothetical protein